MLKARVERESFKTPPPDFFFLRGEGRKVLQIKLYKAPDGNSYCLSINITNNVKIPLW